MDPNNLNKYLYIERTPAWMVRFLYSIGILSWLLVIWGFKDAILFDPVYRLFVAPILVLFGIYHLLEFGINLLYKRLDVKEHLSLIEKFWGENEEPAVDIFLPICGEELNILKNTWENVSKINYKNRKVYVLDDSKERCQEHKQIAQQLGFTYLERPDKGEMKKAGNLKYGFQRSSGNFILILDADFAPHPDILREIVPYITKPDIGIVQTPQYFYQSKDAGKIHRRSSLEYGAAYTQEEFYRVAQVARDRLGGALCCGTNALYKRAALNSIGGPLQVDKSEDSRTGFALLSNGWKIKYLPIILAVGVCPDNTYTYFHQQHRWASGRMEMTISKAFWKAPVSRLQKLSYLTGSLFYLQHPFVILLSFHLFYTLFKYNDYISLANIGSFLPYLIFLYVLLPLFRILPLKIGAFYAGMVQIYSHSHAVITALVGHSVAWISTGAKYSGVSSAFRHTIYAVATYVFIEVILIAIAARYDLLHIFNYNYYSIQFWIFYNIILSTFLLWKMYQAMADPKKREVADGIRPARSLQLWQLKTAGLYLLLINIAFYAIILR